MTSPTSGPQRRLVLVRHAKAAAHLPPDHARELTERGRTDAAAVGRWLQETGLLPDRAVVSTATRTRQTWERMALAGPEPVFDDRVYDADVRDLLEVLADTPDGVTTLVVVGHNPGLEDLARHLDDGTGPRALRAELAAGFPTSAVAVLEVTDWTRPGRLVDSFRSSRAR